MLNIGLDSNLFIIRLYTDNSASKPSFHTFCASNNVYALYIMLAKAHSIVRFFIIPFLLFNTIANIAE